jgi:hypothetical protein
MKIPRGNPPVKDTINAARAKLRAADGKAGLTVDPRCRTLIEDLRCALWPGNLEGQHALAWLRYFLAAEYPIRLERKSVIGSVGISALSILTLIHLCHNFQLSR